MAGSVRIVRVEMVPDGIWVRLWIDDDEGKHQATAEHVFPPRLLAAWGAEWTDAEERRNQPALPGLEV